ncbi:sugar ABC transporter permease [Paenibacillus sp. P3E]|uniref:carbohydrate ABC transporter permease n=1 Tax=unclassified Paenibacillus TaxID=185978 RepID=UPI00093E896C|nr:MULTISPECIES: carbohydrate ABC transporter permease [unclassified Paenibacillus]OKP71331.1 sugar ABC transporter permease [Paenibacillus sp. P3E]OKP90341.1 sugar ABC transporter permease [Paenibacillus sp. P32E]
MNDLSKSIERTVLSAPGKKKTRDINAISPLWNFIFNVGVGLFALSCIFPFIFIIVISFTDEKTLALNGFSILPEVLSLDAYRFLMRSGEQMVQSLGVTLAVTVIGTVLTLYLVSTYAYAISRKNFDQRRFFSFLAFFTMLFSGGLVPGYIVVTQVLHLRDTLWALIFPSILNAFYIIVMRTFFTTTVPDAIIESAKIDGATEFGIYTRIVLPISLPGIATIGLFSTLGFWNDWFNALLYIDNPNLIPLQTLLIRIQNNMDFIVQNSSQVVSYDIAATLPTETVRMAMVVLATLPIALAYPFFQKYFIQGLTIGSVKE